MQWNNARHSFSNLRREARRIRECSTENCLSTAETNAFSLAVFEIGLAVSDAQQWPIGSSNSLSSECIELFHTAAKMAEAERLEQGKICVRLIPVCPAHQGVKTVTSPDMEPKS